MSKTSAAVTRTKFANSKPSAPVATIPAPSAEPVFVTVERNDGVKSHNLDWMEVDGYLYMRIAVNGETTPAKSGKPLISTTRGFAMIGNAKNISLSLNALKR